MTTLPLDRSPHWLGSRSTAGGEQTAIQSWTSHHLTFCEAGVLCVVLATTILIANGYVYGRNTHIEQLPLVLRALDANYLTNDFYVNANTGFGPRMYYTWLLAAAARVIPLPWVVLSLTWLSLLGVVSATFLAARHLLRAGDLTATLAAVLVASVEAFDLGGATFLHRNVLVPQALIMPVVLLMIWAGLAGRPLLVLLTSSISTFIHPLMGPGTAAILLSALIMQSAWNAWQAAGTARRDGVISAAKAACALLGVGALTYVLWVRPQHQAMSTSEFFATYAYLRNPHHCIPSTFPPAEYARTLGFLAVFAFGWWQWRQWGGDHTVATRMLLVVALLIAACIGGYVFVEILPSRLWVTAQTFRFLYVLKWLGLLLLAHHAARALATRAATSRASAVLMLISSGFWQPVAALSGQLAHVLHTRRRPVALAGLALAGTLTASLLLIGATAAEFARLIIGVTLCTWLFATPRRWWRIALPTAALAAFVVIFAIHHVHKLPVVWRVLDPLRLRITLDDVPGPVADIARQARQVTPPNAIILTPVGKDEFGEFRMIAERAIVTDFKTYPFGDENMRAWRQRLEDCYGPVTQRGTTAIAEMNAHYRSITPRRLTQIVEKYGARYAVLHADTPHPGPTLARNARYRLVELSPPVDPQ